METRKIFTNFISGKDEAGKLFACQVDLTPTDGDMPDEFWTDLVNFIVDVDFTTEEDSGKAKDTP